MGDALLHILEGLSSDPQKPHLKSWSWWHVPVISGWGARSVDPGDSPAASLAETVSFRFHKRLSQK